MWKIIDANVRNARYLLNMVLLAGLIYAMATPYVYFFGKS